MPGVHAVATVQRAMNQRHAVQSLQALSTSLQRRLPTQASAGPSTSASGSRSRAVVQRMNTGETYYYAALSDKTLLKEPFFAEFSEVFRSDLKLIGKLREYEHLVQNPATTHNLNTADAKFQTVQADVQRLPNLQHAVWTKHRMGAGGIGAELAKAKQRADELVEIASDDVAQEAAAYPVLQADAGLPASGLRIAPALFSARAGVARPSLLTSGSLAPAAAPGAQPGAPVRLGGGQVSEVTALTYQAPFGRRVFKPNEVKPGTVAGQLDAANVQSAYRVMASGRVEQLIRGQMAVADQAFGTLLGDINLAQYNNKIGTATSFAQGAEAMESDLAAAGHVLSQSYLNVDVGDVTLQRHVANLQLLDVITGQLDRHMGNVKVQQAVGGGAPSAVTGIDNDFAFSSFVPVQAPPVGQPPDTIAQGSKTMFPRLVDKAYAQAILAIGAPQFTLALVGLTAAEKQVAVHRFTGVQQELQQRLANAQLIAATPATASPGERSWSQIVLGDYTAPTKWSHTPGDYMAQMAGPRNSALAAMQNDTRIAPKRNAKNKWVVEYQPSLFLMGRDQVNGADLFALHQQAVAAARPAVTAALAAQPALTKSHEASGWVIRYGGNSVFAAQTADGRDLDALIQAARPWGRTAPQAPARHGELVLGRHH